MLNKKMQDYLLLILFYALYLLESMRYNFMPFGFSLYLCLYFSIVVIESCMYPECIFLVQIFFIVFASLSLLHWPVVSNFVKSGPI